MSRGCPLAEKKRGKAECENCRYKENCIEDILSDFVDKVMELLGETVKEIRRIVKERK